MIYAGFWRRFGSALLDGLIITPLALIVFFIAPRYRLFYLYYFIPNLVFFAFYFFYLVKRFGGTPGQRALDMRIVMLDGSKVTVKAAILRNAVTYVLSAVGQIGLIIAALHTTDAEFFSSDYMVRQLTLMQHQPVWAHTLLLFAQVWVWSEYLVLLFNKKRRGPQDFMAGTVVIRADQQSL